ncbi:MAG: SdpI family protein [Candidatus Pacebacteria bacterium]|nr:SdpI family protein [Candidatus Paceibacterota bacterium]
MRIFTKKEVAPILIIVIMVIFAASLYTAPCISQVPTHWNAKGQIDGWSSKAFAALFFPLLTIAVYLLMLFLPKIDPLKDNYQYFEKQYYFIRLALVLFLAGIYIFTFFAAMGFRFNTMYFSVPFLSALFIALGIFLPKIKKNWFVGIKTPWTLQNDEVWLKTHRFGAKCFILAGILGFLTVFLKSESAFWAFLIIMVIAALLPVIYSYFVYRRINLHGNTK